MGSAHQKCQFRYSLSQFARELLHCPAMPEPPRRFPTPWRAEPIPGGYVVRDANGQALAYLYSRENEDKARQAKTLTNDEARRIALNIARLPELLGNRAAVEAVAGVTEKAAMAA
jgi:hypothetical protein